MTLQDAAHQGKPATRDDRPSHENRGTDAWAFPKRRAPPLPDRPSMRVAPTHLRILASTLDVEGFDAARVLRRCGIESLDALEREGDWVGVDLLDRVMAEAVAESGDPGFGLVVGKSIAMLQFRVFTPLALAAASLRQVLADLVHFSPLALERCEIELLEPDQGGAEVLIEPLVHPGLSGYFRAEQIACGTLQLLRLAGAEARDIREVRLSYPCPPGLAARYAAALGPHVRFEQRDCAIVFNPALLDAPLPGHDRAAYLAARTRAELLLSARRAGTDVAEQVRRSLLTRLPHLPSVRETAAQLGIAERRLRRQLQALGLSHSDLLQQCQRLAAERLLADGTLSLKEVADRVGFSSVSTFHRAFRRWAGVTPATWREQQAG